MNTELEAYLRDYKKMSQNKSTRILITLCVDSSFSMVRNQSLSKINEGIELFLNKLSINKMSRYAVELSIITFGSEIKDICKFSDVNEARKQIQETGWLSGTGHESKMCEGIMHALEQIDEKLQDYSTTGVQYYKPWLIIISDGLASDTDDIIKREGKETTKGKWATREIQKRLLNGKIRTKCISMGKGSETLRSFAEDSEISKMENLEVMDFFEMLSRSVTEFSRTSLEPQHTGIW